MEVRKPRNQKGSQKERGNMLFRIMLFSLFSLLMLSNKVYAAGLDETIEKYFAPFSDKFSSIIFTSISILGTEVPILILLMITMSIFCTFYLRFIGLWGFKHGLEQIFKKKEGITPSFSF